VAPGNFKTNMQKNVVKTGKKTVGQDYYKKIKIRNILNQKNLKIIPVLVLLRPQRVQKNYQLNFIMVKSQSR